MVGPPSNANGSTTPVPINPDSTWGQMDLWAQMETDQVGATVGHIFLKSNPSRSLALFLTTGIWWFSVMWSTASLSPTGGTTAIIKSPSAATTKDSLSSTMTIGEKHCNKSTNNEHVIIQMSSYLLHNCIWWTSQGTECDVEHLSAHGYILWRDLWR